jgi:hypothetical protein
MSVGHINCSRKLMWVTIVSYATFVLELILQGGSLQEDFGEDLGLQPTISIQLDNQCGQHRFFHPH